MTASYKRKRLIEEDCLDKRPTHIKKSLNSSERIKTKKQIQKTINDRYSVVDELRWELETKQCIECHQREIFGPHAHIQNILILLDVGDFDLYKCNCIDFYKLSDEEVLRMSGL